MALGVFKFNLLIVRNHPEVFFSVDQENAKRHYDIMQDTGNCIIEI